MLDVQAWDGSTISWTVRSAGGSPDYVARAARRGSSGSRASDGRYDPDYAEQQARACNWRGARLEREAELRERVLAMLAAGHSPQQVAGRLKREAGRTLISHERIYRFSYALIARTKDYRWRRRLLALQERRSRALLAAALPSKAAEPLAAGLRGLFERLAPTLRRSATFDNGSEFVRHHRLHDLGVETFFCDPHAPWQKGGVENAIGRLRRALPRNTDLDALPPSALHAIIRDYNNTPRKCLDYQTPAEVLHAQLSRLQLEPTFLLAQE